MPSFVAMVNARAQALWTPGTNIAQDESMIPYRGKRNPHHVLVRNKPIPTASKCIPSRMHPPICGTF